MNVKTIVNEGKRGCGFRKKGGTYLITDATELSACGKLPLPLDVCPCCGQGVKASRGWTWINAKKLFADVVCRDLGCAQNEAMGKHCCALETPSEKAGLLWIGEKFYKTTTEFLVEGHKQGFSRRLSQVPRDFELGKTWVMVAHRKAIRCEKCNGVGDVAVGDLDKGETVECAVCHGEGYKPGIFFMFKPERIEYILKGDESQEELERKEERGFTLVNLVRTDDYLDT